MHPGTLKGVRLGAAAVFGAATTALFLDPGGDAVALLARPLTSLQFIPALLKSLAVPGVWIAGALFVLVITFLFGRVYCSTVCPLGLLQDAAIRLRKTVDRRRRFRYGRADYGVHYAVTAFVLIVLAAGGAWALNLVEPFSNFGRICAALLRPPLAAGNNALASILADAGYYGVHPVQVHPAGTAAVIGAALFLVGVLLLSYHRGRLFCNLLCPTGALLGLVARSSVFRIVIDPKGCVECGLCERVCKASCIDSARKRIDMAACIGCFNCIEACPTVGMAFAPVRKGDGDAPTDTGRRRVLAAAVAPVLAGTAGSADTTSRAASTGTSSRPVTPPGAGSEAHFTSTCTACHLCVSACPTRVLAPTFLGYGLDGVFQPRLDFHHSFCNYECAACTTVCPTGALKPLSAWEKKEVQIGTSVFVKEDCIVITKKTDCGACSEHCPTKAVTMVLKDRLFLPELNNDLCVGCGACEHACPTKPRKAIYVEARSVHARAKRPVRSGAPPKIEVPAEFPF